MSHSTHPYTLEAIAELAFKEFHGFDPYPWQVEAAVHSLKQDTGEASPGPLLMVRSTGGGKSAVRNVLGYLREGVSLTIVPLLSLGADQANSIQTLKAKFDLKISCFHLDELQNPDSNRVLRGQLRGVCTGNNLHIYIFSSPQKITRSPAWQAVLRGLADKGLLQITIDECHLYSQFGLEFRQEFLLFRGVMFDYITKSNARVPMLFQSATCSESCMSDLETVTGLTFDPSDLLWSVDPQTVSNRSLSIHVVLQEYVMRSLKKSMRLRLSNYQDEQDQTSSSTKMILYTNSKKRCKRYHTDFSDFMDEELIPGDLVLVHGDLFREQKFHHTRLFCGPKLTTVDSTTGSSLCFDSVLLIATSGTASAGINPVVHYIARDGFPPTVFDLKQELGRLGRDGHASPERDVYDLVLGWSSFAALLYRIYVINRLEREMKASEAVKSGTPAPNYALSLEDLQERQYTQLLEVVSLLFLNPGCVHSKLERYFANPFPEEVPSDGDTPPPRALPPPCERACFYCRSDQESRQVFAAVSRPGLTQVLVDLFVDLEVAAEKRSVMRPLVSLLTSYPSFSRLVYHKPDRKQQPTWEVKILLLKLFAARILIPQVDGKLVYCKLSSPKQTGILYLHDDAAWTGIPVFADES